MEGRLERPPRATVSGRRAGQLRKTRFRHEDPMFRKLALAAVLLAAATAAALPARAQQIETRAREAFIMDFDTGAVLLNKHGDRRMPTASMSKIMTMYMLFERIQDGRIQLTDTMPVSKKAWQKGGSKMFVEVGDRVTVEDLIRGVIVQSGNDAAIVVAEALGGTEEAFAEMMTRKATELGLQNSQFRNATGWPDPQHYMTAHDLAILATILIRRFPEFYHYYSEQSFTYNQIRQGNRNPLLYKNIGADGLKTGHTDAAGYGLTGSAKRGDRRIVMVINGLESARARSAEAERLIDWAFREFDNYTLFAAGDPVADADVWLGDQPTVPLVAPTEIVVTLPRRLRRTMEVTASFEQPIPAPFESGSQAGVLRVAARGLDPISFNLVTGNAVSELGPVQKLVSALEYMVLQGGIAR